MTDTGGAEQVRYDVIIDAKASLDALKQLLRSTESSDAKIKEFTNTVVMAAKKWGVSWSYALNVYKQLNAELSKQHKQTIFGNVGGQNLMVASEQYLKAADSAGRLGVATATVTENTKKTSESMGNAEKSAGGFRRSLDVLRIAMGTLVAMGIFQFINLLTLSFKKAVDGAKQFELALYQIGNAERALSQAGVDITPKDFEAMIKSLKELFPYLSKIDLTRMVGSVALLTKDLGLTREQLEGLVRAIPIMAQRGQVTIEQATQQVVNGLANNGRGWKDLGIVVDAAVIKQEAVTAGLVESADAYNKLTAEQKQQTDVLALLSILNKSVADEQKNVNEYTKTLAGSSNAASAAWEQLLANLGQIASPFLIRGLQFVTYVLEAWIGIFQTLMPVIMRVTIAFVYLFETISYKLNHITESMEKARAAGMKAAGDVAKTMMDEFSGLTNTPTGPKENVPIEIDTSKAQKEVEDLIKDLDALNKKELKINAEFNEKQTREAIDHSISMRRAEQDYQIKRSRYVQDANAAIAEKNKKYREQELNDEAKFQEQLRQLRERFLFDLEDALRERDAKQVIRLQEKYRMDKQDMINEHALKQKEDARQHADDIAQAKKERDDRLAQMDADHRLEMQRKEEDYQLKRAREMEDHLQELEDLKAERQARIEEAAKTIAEELGLREGGAKAMYDMLNGWYGPGGAFSNLFDFANSDMIAKTQQMVGNLMALYAQARAAATSAMSITTIPKVSAVGQTTNTGGGRTAVTPSRTMAPLHAQAFGGSYLAMGPTKTTFGEQGPELATFIPLGRGGTRIPQGGGNTGMGANGNVKIELMLSPDLESRIVENSMNATAEVVVRTINSKG